MAKRKKLQDNNPPRRVEIRGQDHLLAYITPKEAQMLMDNGGAGKPGPMGIPAFYEFGEHDDASSPGQADNSSSSSSNDGHAGNTATSDAETDDPNTAGAGSTEAGYSAGPDNTPGTADDVMGTPGGQLGGYQGSVGQDFGGYIGSYDYGQKVAALEQLNRDLYDISRRQERAKSIPGIVGLLTGKNINNIAAALVGYPPDLLSSINPFSDKKIGPGLDPDTLAGLQSRGIRGATGKDPFGIDTTGIVGFRDSYGNVAYGRDPNDVMGEGGDGPEPEVKPVNPETGQCDAGYMFDTDLQACRLDTGGVASTAAAGQTFAPGAYARMGLLDQTPQGLLQVSGQPYDFDAANRAFRMATATRPEYYSDPYDLTGYTLLA